MAASTAGISALVVCTVARGGGDVSFLQALLEWLAVHAPHFALAVAVIAQAGVDADGALGRLGAFSNVTHVVCGSRVDVGRESTAALTTGWQEASTRAPSTPPAPAVVIQGPLRLFDSAPAACAALGLGASGARLLTLREWGQGRFCPPRPTPDAAAPAHVDVSMGLGDDEVGVFPLAPLPAAALAAPAAAHPLLRPGASRFCCVGYFRTPGHARALGRAVATVVALGERDSAAGSAACGPVTITSRPPVVVVMPAAAAAASGELDHLLEGLRSHPAIKHCSRIGDDGGVAAAAPGDAEAAVITGDVAAGGGGGGDGFEVRVLDLPSLRLPRDAFRALLHACDFAVVTGDASLNEALCEGCPFWYSAEGHKIFTDISLQAAARERAPAVAALWRFLTAAPASVAAAWDAASRALTLDAAASAAGTPLRHVFEPCCAALVRDHDATPHLLSLMTTLLC